VGRRLEEAVDENPDPSLRAAIGVEQRFAAELGRRLTARGVVGAPSAVAYLTVQERIQAVHENSAHWANLAIARHERVDSFVPLDLPGQFWGRPRVDTGKNG
jgi:hypothetical protein